MIIKKFDINSISDFLGGFIEHVNDETKGEIKIVCLIKGYKTNELCLIHSDEKETVGMLLTALDKFNDKKIPPEIVKIFDSLMESLNKK